MSSNAVAKRAFRETPLGKVAMLVVVLIAAMLVARSCGSRDTEVTKEEAVEIARGAIDYRPERVMTRFVPRGVDSRPTWAVSLSTVDERGALDRVTVVVVDGRTGDIVETRVQRN